MFSLNKFINIFRISYRFYNTVYDEITRTNTHQYLLMKVENIMKIVVSRPSVILDANAGHS